MSWTVKSLKVERSDLSKRKEWMEGKKRRGRGKKSRGLEIDKKKGKGKERGTGWPSLVRSLGRRTCTVCIRQGCWVSECLRSGTLDTGLVEWKRGLCSCNFPSGLKEFGRKAERGEEK